MRPGPALCVVEIDDLLRSCDDLAHGLGVRAASLNTAPVTLAALSKECATAKTVVARFIHFLRHYTSVPGVDVGMIDDICNGPLNELSACISDLQVANSRLPTKTLGDESIPQLTIIWNEAALKQILRDLGANRTSLEFLINCAISQCEHADALRPRTPATPTSSIDRKSRWPSTSSLTASTQTAPSTYSRVSDMPGVRSALEELRPEPGTIFKRDARLTSQLHAAIDAEDEPAVVRLLLMRVDPNAPESGSSITPLRRAFDRNSSPIATLLVVAGADLEGQARKGGSALIRGIKCGFSNKFTALVCELGACIDATDMTGRSALHHCADASHRDDNLSILLHAGADVNLKDQSGRTPLIVAVERSNLYVVETLLEHGVDVEASMQNGATALFVAVAKRNYMLAELLMDHGAHLDGQFKDHTALTLAISTASTEIAEMLVEGGANVNLRTSSGNTPILAAASLGDAHITEVLLDADASVDVPNSTGYFPIHMAAHKNRVDVLRLLIDAGSPVDSVTQQNETALSIAVRMGYPDIVQHLTQAAADLDLSLPGHERPIFTALRSRNVEISIRLIQGGVDCTTPLDEARTTTPIHLAAELGLDYVVAAMLRAGVHLEIATWQGFTPLYVAAERGQLSTVRLLLKHGANVRSRFASGGNVLFVSTAHPAVLKLLIEQNIDVNERDLYGATALHYAALWGHAAGAKVLLQKGSRVKHANSVFETMADFREGTPYRQGTPAGLAKQKGHVELAKVIERTKKKI